MSTVRPAAVAGAFYPGDAAVLARDVAALLSEARRYAVPHALPKAVIVPHAGYIYSGPVAASAYALLEQGREVYRRVVLLGPVHRVPVRGLALPGSDAFATPLGTVMIDRALVDAVAGLPQVEESMPAHAWEHSLEVQLPFLQAVLDDFTLLPLAVGDATPQEVAEVLELVWGGAETLIVISSDLSHFHGYAQAQAIDAATAQAILDLRVPVSHEQACGGTPVNGLLLAARHHGLKPQLLDLRNSGDTAGDHSRVVGYAAFAFGG
jgi:AmmeMemoRadiSam system protein B